ncbi:MAG: hypothetical protein WC969_13085 [Elusimicrobiota bacterium]
MSTLHIAAGPGRRVIGPDARALCCDWEAYDALRGLCDAGAWEDEIPSDRADLVMERCRDWTAGWRFDADGDMTLFAGVSLGESYQWLLWLYFAFPACKFSVALEEALARRRPSVLRCEDSVPRLFRDVLDEEARKIGLRVETVAAPARSTLPPPWRMPPMELAPLMRFAGAAVNAAGAVAARRGRRDVWTCYYHVLEPVWRRASESGHPFRWLFANSPSRRLLPTIVRGGGGLLLEHRTPPAFRPAESRALEDIRARWRAAREGPGVPPPLRPHLDAWFADMLPALAWGWLRLQARWERSRPALLVLPFDGPSLQFFLQTLARRDGVPSVMFLHGLPFHYRLDAEHGKSSTFLVWGPEQERIYREGSARLERGPRIERTGNPHFDLMTAPRRSAPFRRLLALSCPVNMLSPLARTIDPERYALETLSAAADSGEWEISFKIHPSESLERYRRLLGRRFPKVRILKAESVAQLILESDLVVGPVSTALIEAMLLRRAVFCVNLTRTPFPPPCDGRWGILLANDPSSLRERLRSFLKDPGKVQEEALAGQERALDAFVGPRDGRSTERFLVRLRAELRPSEAFARIPESPEDSSAAEARPS